MESFESTILLLVLENSPLSEAVEIALPNRNAAHCESQPRVVFESFPLISQRVVPFHRLLNVLRADTAYAVNVIID